MEKRYVLGIDIGGTNFRMGIVDNEFALDNFERHRTQETLADNAVENLIKSINEYLDKWKDEYNVEQIVIGVPGQVGKNHSYVYSVPKIQSLQGVELGQLISEGVGIPVYVEKDTNLLLYHDVQLMNLDPEHNKTILGFYIGTGFGNALYINGDVHTGAHGVAGELGHVPLYGVEDVCNCGMVGCVETRCCGAYLSAMVKREFPGVSLDDVFVDYADDPRIIKFVKDCAIPMATEITLIDPDCIIMGGGVIATNGFPARALEEETAKRVRHPLPAEDLKFEYANDSQTNGVMGAGMKAQRLLAEATK